MKKMFIMILCLVALFLVGCAEEMSDDEIDAALEDIPEDELAIVADDSSAIAGQAYNALGAAAKKCKKNKKCQAKAKAAVDDRKLKAEQEPEEEVEEVKPSVLCESEGNVWYNDECRDDVTLINECGRHNVESGHSYLLSNDLIDETGDRCLSFHALNPLDSPFLVDCNGYSIESKAEPRNNMYNAISANFFGSVDALIETEGAIIKNCNIGGFTKGISLIGYDDLKVKGIHIEGNTINTFKTFPGASKAGIEFLAWGEETFSDVVIDENVITNANAIKFPRGISREDILISNNEFCGDSAVYYWAVDCGEWAYEGVFSGSGNLFQNIGSCSEDWPQLGVHYEECPAE